MVYSATCAESGFTQTVTTFQRTSRVNEQKNHSLIYLYYTLYTLNKVNGRYVLTLHAEQWNTLRKKKTSWVYEKCIP